MPGPFTTPVALSTPFLPGRNPDYLGGISQFTATNTQDAIEEALYLAINAQNFPVQASYNGNGNVGRYLEIFPGEGSDTAPLYSPLNYILTTVTIQAAATSTGAIEIWNLTTSSSIYMANFSGQAKQIYTGLSVGGISSGDEIAFRVATNSVNKPKIRIWLQGV